MYGRTSAGRPVALPGKLDLAEVGRVGEDLADDDPHLVAIDGGDCRLVAVAALHQLAPAGRRCAARPGRSSPRRRAPPARRRRATSSTASPGESGASCRRGSRLMRRAWPVLPISSMKCEPPMPSPASRSPRAGIDAATGDDPQPPDVALGDPVGGVALQRSLVGLQRLCVAAELGERLAQPVVCIGVAAQLEKLLVGGDRRLPSPAVACPMAASVRCLRWR